VGQEDRQGVAGPPGPGQRGERRFGQAGVGGTEVAVHDFPARIPGPGGGGDRGGPLIDLGAGIGGDLSEQPGVGGLLAGQPPAGTRGVQRHPPHPGSQELPARRLPGQEPVEQVSAAAAEHRPHLGEGNGRGIDTHDVLGTLCPGLRVC